VNWIHLAQDREEWRAVVSPVMHLARNLLTSCVTVSFSRGSPLCGVRIVTLRAMRAYESGGIGRVILNLRTNCQLHVSATLPPRRPTETVRILLKKKNLAACQLNNLVTTLTMLPGLTQCRCIQNVKTMIIHRNLSSCKFVKELSSRFPESYSSVFRLIPAPWYESIVCGLTLPIFQASGKVQGGQSHCSLLIQQTRH
jgi:hypothetical protein